MLNVRNSENVLEIRDLKNLFNNHRLLRISNAIESFRGMFVIYCQRDFSVFNSLKFLT